MSKRTPRGGRRPTKARQDANLASEVERLRQELAEARDKLQQIEKEGADAYLKQRMADLDEARLVARGHALDAAAARSKAEAELRALRDAIEKAPGLSGWFMRRASRKAALP